MMPSLNKTDQILAQARALIRRHEGVRHLPYQDIVGKITIGVGRNLTDRGLSLDEITLLFDNDMALSAQILDIWYDWWRDLPEPMQMGLLSMAFNLGGPRLTGFVKLRAALCAGDYITAAKEAKDSKWARQTGQRAEEIAALFLQAADNQS